MKVRPNSILEGLRGAVGDVVFKQFRGRTIVTRKPNFEGVEWSEAQRANRERFRRAAAYGREARTDPAVEAFYREVAEARNKPFFSVMVADYLNPPVIDGIDLDGYRGGVGDEIVVTAHDDVGLVEVTVRLESAGGEAIEEGDAVESPPRSWRWVYRARQAVAGGTTVRVTAVAADRPGGQARAEAEKMV